MGTLQSVAVRAVLWRDKAGEQNGVRDKRRSAHEHKRESGPSRATAKESARRCGWAGARKGFDDGSDAANGEEKRADRNVPSQ